ncbi:MAG: MarR family winged helix-turn-helix transcriptional regulator [Eubacteriales bacterium]|nr:MarR family winged helix-turn-helix transcriptional regulator [Eubacteriales bacterium]
MDGQIESILKGGKFRKLMEEQIGEIRKKYDMKKAELEILYFLSRCDGHNTSTDIHDQLLMNRGHISQAVDSLCKRKFISAIPDERDRRYVHYILLDSAREIVRELSTQYEELNCKILDGISEEELEIFQSVAAKIRNNMEKLI